MRRPALCYKEENYMETKMYFLPHISKRMTLFYTTTTQKQEPSKT
jgi:hypothetical protein